MSNVCLPCGGREFGTPRELVEHVQAGRCGVVDDHLNIVREVLDDYLYGGLPITAYDIAEVTRYGYYRESNDYEVNASMAAVARLTNGKWAAIEGGYGCDTGWSCQASLHATVHDTEGEAWLNVTTDGRALIERQEVAS